MTDQWVEHIKLLQAEMTALLLRLEKKGVLDQADLDHIADRAYELKAETEASYQEYLNTPIEERRKRYRHLTVASGEEDEKGGEER